MSALFLDMVSKDHSSPPEEKLETLLSKSTVLAPAQSNWTSDPDVIRSKFEIGSRIIRDVEDPDRLIQNLSPEVAASASMLAENVKFDDFLTISTHFSQDLHKDYQSTFELCEKYYSAGANGLETYRKLEDIFVNCFIGRVGEG